MIDAKHYNFAFLDEGSKREIRRSILKAVAIPGYQVPFGSRELPLSLIHILFTKPAQWVFEMKIRKNTPEVLAIDFHYCPLVKAWQKAGCSDEAISDLCDIAMCGDRGIGEAYGGKLKLLKSIAKGDEVCRLYYHKPCLKCTMPAKTEKER